MAQWMGQYSGKSHATKVADLEAALRVAIAAMRKAALGADYDRKRVAVEKLAARLLSARVKLYKDRKSSKKIAGGVEAILKEFGVPELTE